MVTRGLHPSRLFLSPVSMVAFRDRADSSKFMWLGLVMGEEYTSDPPG
jgi:hypothetical protein